MLYIEPNAGVQPVLQIIRDARRELDIGVYYLNDRKILAALANAQERGVRVRVIIAAKPYGMKPWQVQKEERAIAATGVQWKTAPYRFTSHGEHYAFYHAKYCANGHEAEIGSANFSWSAFHHNREYLYVTRDPAIVSAVHAVFDADWDNRRAPQESAERLVLSPGHSLGPILDVIRQPGAIAIESEELGPYRPILDALAAKGSELRLLLPATLNPDDLQNVELLRQHGCQVRFLPSKPLYLHAKMIVGTNLAFVGSENFSQTSLEDNREMGVLLRSAAVSTLQQQFDADWQQGQEHPEHAAQTPASDTHHLPNGMGWAIGKAVVEGGRLVVDAAGDALRHAR
ncbi:phospholipase D-like domain-containing protein [Acidithiobacillus sp. AMEEHan]|uniref:phospholipase D-like domain-containing protein n=1 Tax=Acidithiobacillus sp. AMEEHan TaxID=2994951 RepID=UPI0027E415E0|nr:phospholipase D-like domain-containing protein [Acidithiobacillus sp. AMEEHan]